MSGGSCVCIVAVDLSCMTQLFIWCFRWNEERTKKDPRKDLQQLSACASEAIPEWSLAFLAAITEMDIKRVNEL